MRESALKDRERYLEEHMKPQRANGACRDNINPPKSDTGYDCTPYDARPPEALISGARAAAASSHTREFILRRNTMLPSSEATEYTLMGALPQSRRAKWAVVLAAATTLACIVAVTAVHAGALGAGTFIDLKAAAAMPHTGEYCTGSGAKTFTKTTLKNVADRAIYGLLPFAATAGESKFEASDVVRVGQEFYVVCDSSWSILKLSESLPLLSSGNSLIRHDASFTPPSDEDSGFEAIIHDASSESGLDFYVVRESIKHEHTDAFHAQVLKVRFSDAGAAELAAYQVVETCRSEFEFEGDSKGFEGAISLRGADGVLYMLGLCEGNFCSEARGKEVGNGRVVVMKRHDAADEPTGCIWKTVSTLELPKSVRFVDYSAFAVHHSTMAVAVTSQENSQLWVGELSGGSDGKFEPSTATFSEGKVYDFPRTGGTCEVQYCNIEGIHWVSGEKDSEAGSPPQVLVAVSDKMKSKGRQAAVCQDKDQSVHLFTLP